MAADNEYIKRSEVVCLIEEKFKRCDTVLEALSFASLRTKVMGLRSADVAPRAEWISVEERLPDIEPHGKGRYGGARSVKVLCACWQREGKTLVKEGYYEPCGNGIVVWRIPGSIGSVTHWMPLPEPPKGEKHDPA